MDANKPSDLPDINDAAKLGSGKEIGDRLTNPIAIFEDKAFAYSRNRADGDDKLGDDNEYRMRHFATERGKSKGQFCTTAEVSQVMARLTSASGARRRAAPARCCSRSATRPARPSPSTARRRTTPPSPWRA